MLMKRGQPALSILPLYESGALLWEAGQPEQARTLFEKSLRLSEQLHDSFGIAKVNNGLGVLSMSLGDVLKHVNLSKQQSLTVQIIALKI